MREIPALTDPFFHDAIDNLIPRSFWILDCLEHGHQIPRPTAVLQRVGACAVNAAGICGSGQDRFDFLDPNRMAPGIAEIENESEFCSRTFYQFIKRGNGIFLVILSLWN